MKIVNYLIIYIKNIIYHNMTKNNFYENRNNEFSDKLQ